MNERDSLLTSNEFLSELEKEHINLSDRMLRHYVSDSFIHHEKEIGKGNVCFYRRSEVQKVKVIQLLVKAGKTLAEIKNILSAIKYSDKEVLDYLSAYRHAETLTYIIDQLQKGKTINELKKDLVVGAKEEYTKKFTTKYAEDYYSQFRDSLFRLLKEYSDLFPEDEWTQDRILEEFGFLPLKDFSSRDSVKEFKVEFYKRLKGFLEHKQREFNARIEKGIELCVKNIENLAR